MKLASTTRRGFAFLANLLLLLTILVLLTRAQYQLFGIKLPSLTLYDVCQPLSNFESAVGYYGVQYGFNSFVSNFTSLQSQLRPIHFPIDGYRELLTAEIIEILLVIGIVNYVKGRFGITPGKWLFGIHTMSASLRPCGFASALARNVLRWVDFLFFATPIPAAISMTLSPNLQRLGDRVAQTIVVNADSIRKADESAKWKGHLPD